MNRWTIILIVLVILFIAGIAFTLIRPANQTPTTTVTSTTKSNTTGSTTTAKTTGTTGQSAGTAGSSTGTTTVTTTALIDEQTAAARDEAQKTNFAAVTRLAQQWQSDASLYGIKILSDRTLSTNKTVEAYIFGSSHDLTNWYIVTVNEGSLKAVRQLSPKEDLFTDLATPVKLQFFKLGPFSALRVLQAAVDAKTILPLSTPTGFRLVLRHSLPSNHLNWIVEVGQNGSIRTFSIDATSSELIETTSSGPSESTGLTP